MAGRCSRRPITRWCLVPFSLALTLGACRWKSDPVPAPTLIVLEERTPTATSLPSVTPTRTFSPTAALTLTLTFTPSATNTLSPTPTATLTLTSTQTATSTPFQVVVSSDVGAYVRSGPGIEYEVVGTVEEDQTFNALAHIVTQGGDIWYLIEWTAGTPAWISAWVAVLEGDVEIERVARAVTIPPTPTPSPTLTPTQTPIPSPTPTLPPGANAQVSGREGVNLRDGAGTQYQRLQTLPPGTPLLLIGRNQSMTWLEVATFEGRFGWVSAEFITVYNSNVGNLPVSWVDLPTQPPLAGVPGISASFGQNRPNVFAKVGDSITANQPFLYGFGEGKQNLGPYGYLQETIDFFTQVSPRPGVANSFTNASVAASTAFNAAAVLDPIWADRNLCQPGESPLECEYRLIRPAVSIIMLGSVDMQIYDVNQFRTYLNQIVQITLDRGIIPVLTTFPNRPDFYWEASEQFNAVIREIAAQRGLPLIELRTPALALPSYGVTDDKFHLSNGGDPYNFNGDQNAWGVTLRNFLTLQMLDQLRRTVLAR
jgi:uncharacterized protein YgiM (DUF1202 family)